MESRTDNNNCIPASAFPGEISLKAKMDLLFSSIRTSKTNRKRRKCVNFGILWEFLWIPSVISDEDFNDQVWNFLIRHVIATNQFGSPSEAAELSNQNPINLISSSGFGLLMEATLLIGNEIQISFMHSRQRRTTKSRSNIWDCGDGEWKGEMEKIIKPVVREEIFGSFNPGSSRS